MRRIIITLVVALITLIAYANVALASGNWSYQPDVPAKLRK